MSVPKRYAKLDDVGFVGFQKHRSKAEIKKDADRTARFIKTHKAKKRMVDLQENESKPCR